MIVTINTDASFSKLYQRGTYAFWIKSNKGKITKSGLLRNECSRPEIAEFRCIVNAMHKLAEANWADITKVIINTDCMNVIYLIARDNKKIKRFGLFPWGSDTLNKFESMVSSYRKTFLKGVPIELRHVKAHVSTKSDREWVNDWCDKEAKRHMAAYLKTQLIQKENE